MKRKVSSIYIADFTSGQLNAIFSKLGELYFDVIFHVTHFKVIPKMFMGLKIQGLRFLTFKRTILGS